MRPLKFPLPLPPLCRKWENPAPVYFVWIYRWIVSTSGKGATRQGTCLGAFSYSGNKGARNNAEDAIKNNAENAIKSQRMIVHPWRPALASVFCKDQAARQSARNACLARGSFVDSAGRSMVEYGHGRTGRVRARANVCIKASFTPSGQKAPVERDFPWNFPELHGSGNASFSVAISGIFWIPYAI